MSSNSKTTARTGAVLAAVVLYLIAAAGVARLAEAGGRRPKLQWKFAFAKGNWVVGLAIGREGVIYARLWAGNNIYALAPDGALVRKFATGNPVSSLAVGPDGTIYAGTIDHYIYAFDPDGALKWSPRAGAGSAVAGCDGAIYAPEVNDVHVYEFAPDSTLRRKFTVGNSVRVLAAGTDGSYAGTADSHVYAFAPDGALKWKVAPGAGVSALAVGSDGVVYVGSHLDYRVRDPVTGAIRHVVGASAPVVYALDPQTGSAMWSSKVSKEKIFSLKVARKGTVYVGSYDGNIYALDPHSGTLRWRFSTGTGGWGASPVHALAVANDGTIYAGAGSSVEAISPP